MKFEPHKDYNSLLKQANALRRCYEIQQEMTAYYKARSSDEVAKLRAELESEKEMNEILTLENERLERELEIYE